MDKIIILDAGHGVDCAGKRSPIWGDGSQLLEWEFNRDIVRRIAAMLKAEGIKFEILVPEDNDVSLSERCRRANVIYDDCGQTPYCSAYTGTPEAAPDGNVIQASAKRKPMKLQPSFVMRQKRSLPRMVGKCVSTIATATRTKKANFIF